MSKLTKYVLCVCLGLVLCGTAQANLLTNGGFEDGDCAWLGDSPSIPGWTYWGTDGWHMNDAGYVMDSKGMLVWWDSVGMYQDVFGVVVGQEYEFSVSAITKAADKLRGWDLMVKAEWTAENWATIGSSEIGRFIGAKSESNPGDGTDTWKLISGTAVAPEGAAHGKIYFQLTHDGVGADWGYTGGSVCFDNASVVLVPEPATMALLGLGGLFFIRRRK
ncbi:MAG: PEP-CTERM sorting domain-containing protein [Phycisphaerae bacterium]|jgi:hypothetical protein